jgi:Flp pilus assembly pilin Flp
MWGVVRHTRDDQGAAAVEFALVLPLLVFVLFMIIQFGLIFDAKVTVTHAAREGARVASVGGSLAAVQSAVTAQTSNLVSSRVKLPVSVPLLGGTTDPRGSYYEVTVEYTYPLEMPVMDTTGRGLISFKDTIVLKSTAQMRREN